MGFWPTGPITTFSMLLIFLICGVFFVFGGRTQRCIAAALLVSWIGARSATVLESQFVMLVSLTAAGIISFFGITLISRCIATLYACRLALLSLVTIGYDWFLFWELNRVFLYLQILLALGTLFVNGIGVDISGSNPDRRGNYRVSLLPIWRHFRSAFR
jgi:cbb3-type cytochrome oxidase subunit 3